MSIISINETVHLIDDISNIVLPPDVEVYISFGVPQLFQRISTSVTEGVERDWLYVPMATLDSYTNDTLSYLKCKNKYLFPISPDRNIEVLLVSKEDNINAINGNTINSILSVYDDYKTQHNNEVENSDLFLETLANNNDSISSFIKAILNVLVRKIPRSCAAYYSDENNQICRQVVTGDISKIELMSPVISEDYKSDWEEKIKNKNFIIPLCSLPDRSQFLINPPDVKFIYNGLNSEHTNNYISVLVSGNSYVSSISFLTTITKMFGKFSETHFIKSIPVLEYYKSKMFLDNTKQNTTDLIRSLFSLLSKQMKISRLLFMQNESSTEIGFNENGIFDVQEKIDIKLVPRIQEQVKLEQKLYVQTNCEEKYYRQEKDNGHDAIVSELIYHVSLPNNLDGYISIGIKKNVEYFSAFSEYIDNCIDAFTKCNENHFIQSSFSETSHKNKLLLSKIQLSSELSSGCFNQISSKMTVLLGKSSQLQNKLSMLVDDDEINAISNYIMAIEKSADTIGEIVKSLQSLLSNEDEYYERKYKSAEIMKSIPKLFSGYLHYTYINRNVSIRIDNLTQMKSGFMISCIEAYSVIIPIILMIIKSSKHDGTIAIEAKRELEASYIRITFNKSLIGDIDLSGLIFDQFKKYNISVDEVGMFSLDNLIVSHTISEEEMVEIKVRLKQVASSAYQTTENNKEELASV